MLSVRDVMRAGPLTLEPGESLRAAVDVLVASGSGGAPVVNGGQLMGVVSLSDILAFEQDDPVALWQAEPWELDGGALPGLPRSEWEALEEHSVSEVMTRTVIAVPPEMPIREAADVMDRAGVHRLVVTEHGSLVGVLGARDIVHALARGELVAAPEFDR